MCAPSWLHVCSIYCTVCQRLSHHIFPAPTDQLQEAYDCCSEMLDIWFHLLHSKLMDLEPENSLTWGSSYDTNPNSALILREITQNVPWMPWICIVWFPQMGNSMIPRWLQNGNFSCLRDGGSLFLPGTGGHRFCPKPKIPSCNEVSHLNSSHVSLSLMLIISHYIIGTWPYNDLKCTLWSHMSSPHPSVSFTYHSPLIHLRFTYCSSNHPTSCPP